jgi:prophage regulatory protein
MLPRTGDFRPGNTQGQTMVDQESRAQHLLRRKEVEQWTGLCRSSIYKRMRNGTFPPAIPLGGRRVGWRVGEIERFLSNPSRYRAPRASAQAERECLP